MTNPYKQWIHTYISEGFSRSTDQAVSAFDTLAQQVSTHERELMIDTFCHSMRQEWLFWDDAYHGRYVEKRLT
jgi:thiaminase/transcriptional activator TenA